jgi:hypothetical protein
MHDCVSLMPKCRTNADEISDYMQYFVWLFFFMHDHICVNALICMHECMNLWVSVEDSLNFPAPRIWVTLALLRWEPLQASVAEQVSCRTFKDEQQLSLSDGIKGLPWFCIFRTGAPYSMPLISLQSFQVSKIVCCFQVLFIHHV